MTANLVRAVPQWMTETHAPVSDLEKRVADLQRQHDKTRDLLAWTMSLLMVVIAGLWLEPQGFFAIAGVTWTTMAVTSFAVRRYLKN